MKNITKILLCLAIISVFAMGLVGSASASNMGFAVFDGPGQGIGAQYPGQHIPIGFIGDFIPQEAVDNMPLFYPL